TAAHSSASSIVAFPIDSRTTIWFAPTSIGRAAFRASHRHQHGVKFGPRETGMPWTAETHGCPRPHESVGGFPSWCAGGSGLGSALGLSWRLPGLHNQSLFVTTCAMTKRRFAQSVTSFPSFAFTRGWILAHCAWHSHCFSYAPFHPGEGKEGNWNGQ